MNGIRVGNRVIDPENLRLTPRLYEPAPDFEANTTHGRKRLSDYRGRWLVLFSHPADFTPVCASEIVGFSQAYEQFQALGCELLGLSIDSNFSHLAWIRSIKEKFGVQVPFPIIEDVSMWVASTYGMIQPGASDTSTVRAVFIIDPEGVLRGMLYYPLAVGRSVAEILRLVTAMQTCDRHSVYTPEGWQPGDKAILPPPETAAQTGEPPAADQDYVDWYYRRTDV